MVRGNVAKYFLFIALIWFTQRGICSHNMGGEMSYTLDANNKLIVTAKLYRDCRGIAMGLPVSGYVAGVGGGTGCGTVKLGSTRISIQDITPRCSNKSLPCKPLNTGSRGEGIEEHVFVLDTIDITKGNFPSYIAGSTCCEITFYIYSNGGRNGAITTGPAGNNFYITLSINFCNLRTCKNKTSQGPKWENLNNIFTCCNKSTYIKNSANDTDEDLLRYSLTPALSEFGTSVLYSPPFSFKYPVTPYCVPSNTIKCAYNINSELPKGTYFDTSTGILIFTPTKCDEVSVVDIKYQEYRADTSGKLVVISSGIRDFQIVVKDDCRENNSPKLLYLQKSYRFCEGDPLEINFEIFDEPFTPYQTVPDTVSGEFLGNFPGAVLKYKDPKSREKACTFYWQRDTLSSIIKRPLYLFASDNHCPRPAFISNVTNISAYPNQSDTLQLQIHTDSCGGVIASIPNDSLFAGKGYEYDWTVFNLNSGRNYLMKTTTDSVLKLTHTPKGNYKISVSAFSSSNCIRKSLEKTFYVPGFYGTINLDKDTSYCVNSPLEIKAEIAGFSPPVKYKWEYTLASKTPVTKTDTSSILKLLQPNYNIILKSLLITDNNNCSAFNNKFYTISQNPLPVVQLGNDTTICENDIFALKVPNVVGEKYQWNTGDTSNTILVQNAGEFVLNTTSKFGCSAADTIIVFESKTPTINIKSADYCDLKDTLDLNSFMVFDGKSPTPGMVIYYKHSLNNDTITNSFKNYKLHNGYLFSNLSPYGNWKFRYVVNNPACPTPDGIIGIGHHSIPISMFTAENMVEKGNGIEVPFVNQSSNADKSNLMYNWIFTDGNPEESMLKDPIVLYPLNTSSYKVKLTTISSHCIGADSSYININYNALNNPNRNQKITADLRLVGHYKSVELKLHDASGRLLHIGTDNAGIKDVQLPEGIYTYSLLWIENEKAQFHAGRVIIPLIR